jgi:hypothetical protein
MSKLIRGLVLGAMLAVLSSATAAAAPPQHPLSRNEAVKQFRAGERASQEQTTSDSVKRVAEAQERYYSTWGYGDTAVQVGLAQERYYSTWGYGDTPTPAPAEPSGQPDWLVLGLGVLAAALALSTGLAVLAARRANRRVRVGQTA